MDSSINGTGTNGYPYGENLVLPIWIAEIKNFDHECWQGCWNSYTDGGSVNWCNDFRRYCAMSSKVAQTPSCKTEVTTESS